MLKILSFLFFVVSLIGVIYLSGGVEYIEAAADDTKENTSNTSIQKVDHLKKLESELQKKRRNLELQALTLREKEEVLEAQAKNYELTISKLKKELRELKRKEASGSKEFASVYSQMDAKPAAKILNSMDLKMASRILSSLNKRKAAEIMARMEPKKAKQITERQLSSMK